MILTKFKGPKSFDVIRAQCTDQALTCNSNLYETADSDHVTVFASASPDARVYFNVFSGRFFGTNHLGESFDSDQPRDNEPWVAALLDFFLEPLPGAAGMLQPEWEGAA